MTINPGTSPQASEDLSVEIPVVEPTPIPEEDDPNSYHNNSYIDFRPYFGMYGHALRIGQTDVTQIIEEMMSLAHPHSTLIRLPKRVARELQAKLHEAERDFAVDQFAMALNDPEGVDPRALGDRMLKALNACGGDAAKLGELLHKGY
jgi:hypothetical protein